MGGCALGSLSAIAVLCTALHPQDLGVLGMPGTGEGRNLPSPQHERVGSQRVSAVPFAGAPRAAGKMEKLILTQPLSSVCLCLQEPPSV